MGKKKIATDGGESLSHNPFAALQGLQDLPDPAKTEADEQRTATEPARPAANSTAPRGGATKAGYAFGSKLVVRRQRKGHGGKTVTIVEGLGLEAEQLATLAKGARKALGRGARVDGSNLIVAGAQHEQVRDWLERQGATTVVLGN